MKPPLKLFQVWHVNCTQELTSQFCLISWRFNQIVLFASDAKEMSYNDTAHYVAEIFIKKRLDALLGPIVGINHGRNAP